MTNDEIPKDEGMTNELMTKESRTNWDRPYDLEERTALFGEAIIDFAKLIPVTPITRRLIDQLVGAATSVGANYCEADDAVSKKDFRYSSLTLWQL